MNARVMSLGLAAALCALPLLATSPPDIPGGDDFWDTPGAGTNSVITSADWFALCGVTVPDTTVSFKGFNIPGEGAADTVVTRLQNASLPSNGSSATVNIQLKDLSFVSNGTHPCSPLTLRVKKFGPQAVGTMTITRTSSAGGTYSAVVPVSVVIEAVNSSGSVVGSTYMNGSLTDTSASPWSYAPPTGGATRPAPWYPAVDPVTHAKSDVCRFGNETAPSTHCYKYPPPCGQTGTGGTGTGPGTGTPGTGTGIGRLDGVAAGTGETQIGEDENDTFETAETCFLEASPANDTIH